MKGRYHQKNLIKLLLLFFSIYLTSCNASAKNNIQENSINQERHSTLQTSSTFQRDTSIKGKEVYQKVDEVSNWLEQGNYQEIEQFFQQAITNKTFTATGRFYASAVLSKLFEDSDYSMKTFDHSWQTYLDSWIKESPNSSIAYLVRSVFYFNYAWELRGNRFIQKTPEAAKQEFMKKMFLSVSDIKKSLSLDAENPLIIANLLIIGNSYSMPRETFEAYFQKAINLIPYFSEVYMAKTIYLEPQWYGSEVELLAFARETTKFAPKGSALPLTVIIAHKGLCSYSDLSQKEYYGRPKIWQEIQSSYERLIKELPESGYYAFEYAELARKIGREDIAQYNYNVAWEREANHPIIYKTLSPQIR
jgi:hypothetical protein